MLADSISDEGPLPGFQVSPSHCVLTWWREVVSLLCLVSARITFMKA